MGYEKTFAEAKNTAVRGSYPLKEVISVKNGITTQYFALEKSLLTSVKINVKKPSGKNFHIQEFIISVFRRVDDWLTSNYPPFERLYFPRNSTPEKSKPMCVRLFVAE
jgi:hypothetical protein